MAHRTIALHAISKLQPASVLTRVQRTTEHPAQSVMVHLPGCAECAGMIRTSSLSAAQAAHWRRSACGPS